ncbi:4'-phosphopantetheinyl transferase superfamily protein [Streptomyces sp. AM 2-1-1]|uniref:4'-phosphopantetheinyl transferase superfamily protein n=1 Tax=Streptomyces sp. AM 2-1-1 TaxID=3028709 RepID=UPI0023B8A579|nr:4'-phosphopantetheinyl transferase superfamily protein [Streptomyces sp. AM 2-1-1]WEH39158.1 4'-phosphopantetheinyl transferase superfamily protein [Streptomyces sp. AM 2-1-1]
MTERPRSPEPPSAWLLGGSGRPRRVLLETVPVGPPGGTDAQHRAGRAAAAAVLRRAGCACGTVGRRRSGAPVFPPGYAGSVTHTESLAVAAVAPGSRGVGVDLEFRLPEARLHRFLLDDSERASLWPDGDRERLRRLFAAKEAAFKALTECHEGHGGLFWRVRLRPHGDGLWARAGDRYAVVRDETTSAYAFAVAVAVGADPGPWADGTGGPAAPSTAISRS